MRKRQLGKSDLHISPVGLGSWAMGGEDWKFGWGPQEDQKSIRTIHEAIDLGINWIDTAPIYGHGHAETLVGKALQGKRDQVLLATKCGRIWRENSREIGKCLLAESIFREVEDSLRRLQTDVIDLYQIHWPEPDEQIEEGWGAVARLKEQGKIRFGGVSNFLLPQLQRAQAVATITSLQPPYSMLRRDVEVDEFPYCEREQIGVIAYSPMQCGLLTGKYTSESIRKLPDSDWRKTGNPYFQEPQLSWHLEVVERIGSLARNLGATTSQMSLAWLLHQSSVTGVIVGAREPAQIAETMKAGDLTLLADVLDQIHEILENHRRRLEGRHTEPD